MSAALMKSPALTSTPLSVRLPAPGRVVIFTAASALAGLSAASLKPKSAAANVYALSSSVVTVLLAPAGASLTAVTSMLMVLADWIEVHATVDGAAVVLHLEGEAGVARAVGVGHRGEHQLAAGDVGDA